MAKKLYFRYGAMGASKTANALMAAYNYSERGQHALIMKPAIDTRDGEGVISSRIGLKAEAYMFSPEDDIGKVVKGRSKKIDCIIVDEAQFLTPKQVEQLSDLSDFDDIPVICYGLRTDFMGCFFPGSRALMEMADTIEEIKTICWCGKKATCNARIQNGKVLRVGEQILIGGNDSYVALCRKHWKDGDLGHRF